MFSESVLQVSLSIVVMLAVMAVFIYYRRDSVGMTIAPMSFQLRVPEGYRHDYAEEKGRDLPMIEPSDLCDRSWRTEGYLPDGRAFFSTRVFYPPDGYSYFRRAIMTDFGQVNLYVLYKLIKSKKKRQRYSDIVGGG